MQSHAVIRSKPSPPSKVDVLAATNRTRSVLPAAAFARSIEAWSGSNPTTSPFGEGGADGRPPPPRAAANVQDAPPALQPLHHVGHFAQPMACETLLVDA